MPKSTPVPGRPRLGSAVVAGLRSLIAFHPRTLRERIIIGLRDAGYVDGEVPPIVFMRHHLAHAASAFYCSGFEASAILVFDGHGEENATSIYRADVCEALHVDAEGKLVDFLDREFRKEQVKAGRHVGQTAGLAGAARR